MLRETVADLRRRLDVLVAAGLSRCRYGDAIDALVAAGRCPPDGWRTPPLAEVVE